MIRFLLLLTFVAQGALGMAQDAWPNKSRVLPEKLRKVPVAMTLMHSPNPNYPEANTTGTNKKMPYVWKHATTVCSPEKELTVMEAGSFIWYNPSGWKTNVQYDKKDFQKKFDCPGGVLKAGQCYTFVENYRWGIDLYGGDALWFVLAKDAEGNVYKGMGIIETEAELKSSE